MCAKRRCNVKTEKCWSKGLHKKCALSALALILSFVLNGVCQRKICWTAVAGQSSVGPWSAYARSMLRLYRLVMAVSYLCEGFNGSFAMSAVIVGINPWM